MKSEHIPVLREEVIKILNPKANQNFIDLTLGYGGHAALILEKTAPNGKLLGIEQDVEAIEIARERLDKFVNRVTIINDNFTEIGLIIRSWDAEGIDGILLDLGPNTEQLKSDTRGLSFRSSSPLDMRLDKTRQKIKASDILNKYSQKQITDILYQGEEKFAKAIAAKIVANRKIKPINTTDQLVEIIRTAIPPVYRVRERTHFATATFRSLRIAVNNELNNLKRVLPQAISALSENGRIVIISFHSLEDRIVKNFLREQQNLEILTPKPLIASAKEITANPSSRSAKLRAAVKN